jgi:hypothetical protein
VARALKKIIRVLNKRGVLLPPSQSAKSPTPNSPCPERSLPK